MPYGNAVAVTEGPDALVLGHVFGLDDIIAVALIVVLSGLALYRYGSRIERARKLIFTLVAALAAATVLLVHLGGLGWRVSCVVGLAAAVAALLVFARLVSRERHAVV